MATRLYALGCVALFLAAATRCSEAQPSYKLVDLGIGEAISVNGSGTVVGFQWISNAAYPFIWDSVRGLRSLALPPGCSATPLCVNNYGEAVGYMNTPTNPFERAVCLSEDEVATDMNTLLSPADHAIWDLQVANSINDEGIVVGYGDKNGVQQGWMMDMKTSPPTITSLDCPGFTRSIPNWVTQSCLIVGDHDTSHSFMFPEGGSITSIPLTQVVCANENGDIVGRTYVPNVATMAAFLSAGGTVSRIGTLGGTSSTSSGVNTPTNGFPTTVVGYSDLKGQASDQHGFRWQVGGKITDLTSLVSNLPNRKWYVRLGYSVNGSGIIAGQASDGTSSTNGSNKHAIVLIPK